MTSIDATKVETVGPDLGQRWFHVHDVAGQGRTCINRWLPGVVLGHAHIATTAVGVKAREFMGRMRK